MTLLTLLQQIKIYSILPERWHKQARLVGYAEKRNFYTQPQFANRCIHLGGDIELPAGTEIFCPVDATVHSFADNAQAGDYGPTLILQHRLADKLFYTLYGHLSRGDLAHWRKGQCIEQGKIIGHIGTQAENGGWPPHLHLQLINQIGNHHGDYPGVCTPEQAKEYLNNCPNPEILIGSNG